ncbi:LLM class flavin-dependent oxidoreductase, partial [Croceicoccus bisphenolivorans]|uniref:LLM class flavin-dependent oxidoreductase n=1 Tax=Croceicoccus bisphenolivorans TaxID=1783232 RepID=UPI001560EB0B
VQDHFATYWSQWTRAESLGFEGIFFSEHHFGPGYSPSPNLLVAALAPVTKTLRLGVMGVVLPYYEPWRVIEEIGMLDHLLQGRLEIGTASGIPPEMAQVGLGVALANERNAEAQELLDWALTHPGQPITHHGKHWNFDNLTLVPQPLQAKPNRWTTVVSEASARRSATRGTRICTGFNSVEQVRKVFDGYREEADRIGLAHSPDS